MQPPSAHRRGTGRRLLRAAVLLVGAVSAAPPGPRSGSGLGLWLGPEAVSTAAGPDVPAMPPDAWDSHIHVTDPERYAVVPSAQYTPRVHTVGDNAAFERGLGCRNVVLVQPSIYGADNGLLLDALRTLGRRRARAVVVLDDAAAANATLLRQWHALGVRGVRVNLRSGGVAVSPADLAPRLARDAAVARALGWVLQLYMPMRNVTDVAELLPKLGVRVVFDHVGAPRLDGGPVDETEGLDALIGLVRAGSTWVKLSGPYRTSRAVGDPEYGDLDPVIRRLMAEAPSRLVYGSDWPHTRFEGLDIRPWTRHLLNMTRHDDKLRHMIFAQNAHELWDGDRTWPQ